MPRGSGPGCRSGRRRVLPRLGCNRPAISSLTERAGREGPGRGLQREYGDGGAEQGGGDRTPSQSGGTISRTAPSWTQPCHTRPRSALAPLVSVRAAAGPLIMCVEPSLVAQCLVAWLAAIKLRPDYLGYRIIEPTSVKGLRGWRSWTCLSSLRSPLGPRTPGGGAIQATPKYQATMATPLPVDHPRGATVRVYAYAYTLRYHAWSHPGLYRPGLDFLGRLACRS
ncbi:hypothetical protein EHS25_006734 [Saitozyma podzolica]|uniref:Uncharacterized protein n=1 Tax=Saitozyma podzolica TaxID=1890683 RepID=A0A427YSJ1_9TREE|nr:hypothetical protein EHS25_006734 [Saitozyma podzolica]